jgi:SAM-dependent methyltransferase
MDWLSRIRHHIVDPGSVLEVGSWDINGSPREFFSDAKSYVGVDANPGPGVDEVADGEHLATRFGRESQDVVLACEVLEHAEDPLEIASQMRAVLKPRGWMIVTSPTNCFPLHRHPRDYWRLMPDAYDDLVFRGMEIVERECVGTRRTDSTLCYLGRKP